jgi:Thiolase, N-terminal domain
VNRLCGSGFQSVVNGTQEILVGDSSIVLTGGTDNMSACPYAVRDIRYATGPELESLRRREGGDDFSDPLACVLYTGIVCQVSPKCGINKNCRLNDEGHKIYQEIIIGKYTMLYKFRYLNVLRICS